MTPGARQVRPKSSSRRTYGWAVRKIKRSALEKCHITNVCSSHALFYYSTYSRSIDRLGMLEKPSTIAPLSPAEKLRFKAQGTSSMPKPDVRSCVNNNACHRVTFVSTHRSKTLYDQPIHRASRIDGGTRTSSPGNRVMGWLGRTGSVHPAHTEDGGSYAQIYDQRSGIECEVRLQNSTG